MTFLVNEQNVSVMYIDINAISLYLDLNILQQEECFCAKLGMEVEYATSKLNASLSQIWVICEVPAFVRVGQSFQWDHSSWQQLSFFPYLVYDPTKSVVLSCISEHWHFVTIFFHGETMLICIRNDYLSALNIVALLNISEPSFVLYTSCNFGLSRLWIALWEI